MADRRSLPSNADKQLAEWRKRFLQTEDAARPIADADRVRFEAEFLRAVNQARRKAVRPVVQQAVWFRYALGGALTIAVLIGALCLFQPQNVRAFPQGVFQGQVISAQDGRPIPAVKVYHALTGKYETQSDACGMFTLSPPAAGSAEYNLRIYDSIVAICRVGSDRQAVLGMAEIVIPQEKFTRSDRASVLVAPGKETAATAGLSVALGNDAKQTWRGVAIKENDWPQVFNYGRVVDGVYLLEGPAGANLALRVTLADRRLRELNGSADQLRVIAYDNRYAAGELETDLGFNVMAYARGWYRLDAPPNVELQADSPTIHTGETGTTITWRAEPGKRYALLLPPLATGKVVACYVEALDRSDNDIHKCLKIVDQQLPQMGIYDVIYTDTNGKSTVRNEQPLHRDLIFPLDQAHRGRNNDGMQPAFTTPLIPGSVPGQFTIRLYDFTMTDPVDYPPLQATFPKHANYGIEVTPGPVGGITQLVLTGQLDKLSDPPAWDFGSDYVDDAFGSIAELYTPYAGGYKVNVTLREESGAVMRLERWVNIKAGNVVGFVPGRYTCAPILKTTPTKPAVQTKWLSQTVECVPNPQPYGYSSSEFLGPQLMFTPPPEFCETELKELQLVLYVSPLSGDTDPQQGPVTGDGVHKNLAVYLVPALYTAGPERQWESGQPTISVNGLTPGYPRITEPALGGVSYALLPLIPLLDNQQPIVPGLVMICNKWSANNDMNRLDGFKLNVGIDLVHLPGEAEARKTVGQFVRSDYFAVRYAVEAKQRIPWSINLHGFKLEQGGSFIVSISAETRGLLINAQYLLFSGGETPSQVKLVAADGRECEQYLDYSAVIKTARLPGA